MDVLSMVISLLSFIFSIVTFFKLHIIYVPIILCELAGASPEVTGTVLTISCLVWIATVIKTIINYFN